MLYGRRSGYHLSDLGREMARRVADTVGDRDITRVVSSPLERAQETAAPGARGVEIVTDERVIESSNVFEGETFGVGDGVLRQPKAWRHLWNPLPPWGEPYKQVAARMLAGLYDARDAALGHEAVIVSHRAADLDHQAPRGGPVLPPRPAPEAVRLCSLTSFTFDDERLTTVRYSEPAADLIPIKDRKAPFSAGGAADEDKPAAGV